MLLLMTERSTANKKIKTRPIESHFEILFLSHINCHSVISTYKQLTTHIRTSIQPWQWQII